MGFSILFNFFSRLIVYHQRKSCLLTLKKKEVRPHERIGLHVKILRVLYFPLYYSNLMERMNILHYGAERFVDEVSQSGSQGYPLLTSHTVEIDPRDEQDYTLERLEGEVRSLSY